MKQTLINFRQKSPFKKILASILALLVVLQGLFVIPRLVDGATTATNKVRVVQNDVYVDIDENLTDLGNRYYRLNINAASHIKSEYRTTVQEYSEDGYYVVEEDGYYLVELWGGKGADGEASDSNPGGYGGGAGYVYGYSYLTKGQTILFTIGTDGKQAEITEGGGGANEGGNHETWSFYKVGGGGGYSAVYLFDYAKTSFSLTESERLSNYVLIAGGGGGGGAGSNWLENTGNRPSGGDGGLVTGSLSGHLNAADNSGVAGTYFAGRDGRSSGTVTDYVGKGGTNVPGKMPTTWSGYTGVINPNDWTGTYSDNIENDSFSDYDLAAGCGGMGARRGGAGGAGFCGGSGGFQSALSVSTNVGGGGGGSSFIADSLTYKNLPSSVSKYLNGANYSHVGGSCIVTYLGNRDVIEKEVSTDHMKEVEIKGRIAPYFEIVDVKANAEVSTDADGNIIFTNANIAPDEAGYIKNTFEAEITFKANDTFAGGNNVPITHADGKFTLTPVAHDSIEINEQTSNNYTVANYVNVPLKGFYAVGHSYMSNDSTREYQLSELYTNNISSLTNGLDCSFLTIDSSYTVKNSSGTTITSSPIKVSVTDVNKTAKAVYTVGFNVAPNNTTIAAIGNPVIATFFSDTATLTYVAADAAGTLNGLDIDATKLLSRDGNNYILNTNVNQKGAAIFVPNAQQDITSSTTYEIQKDGWYYIQSWGGNGGSSSSPYIYNYYLSAKPSKSASGASGGSGGYVDNYVYLTAGQVLNITVGSAGSTGGTSCHGGSYNNYYSSSKNVNISRFSYGGGGGGATTVVLGDSTIIIAGGGGGAGGAGIRGRTAGALLKFDAVFTANGTVGASSTSVTTGTAPSSSSSFNGTSGGRGEAKWNDGSLHALGGGGSTSSGKAGTAGVSFKNTSYGTTQNGQVLSPAAQKYAEGLTTVKNGTSAGLVRLTLLESEDVKLNAEQLYGLETSGTVSKYFEIEDFDLETAFDYSNRAITDNGDGSFTVTYSKSGATIARVTYKLTPNADGSTNWSAYDTYYSPDAEYTPETVNDVQGNWVRAISSINFVLKLSPKEGFMGGNDVPLVLYETAGAADTGLKITQNGQSLWLNKKDISDYANVEINYTFEEQYLTADDVTITCGQSVNQAEIVYSKIPMPTGSNAWQSDFVKAVHPPTKTVSPTVTTQYTYTQQITPKADAQKAVVLPTVSGVSYSKSATVYVNYTVNKNLSHISYEGPDIIASGNGLTALLEADAGYSLPESITVTVGGATLSNSNYSYNSETGALNISTNHLTGNVVITANAKVLTYGIYYNYQDPVTQEQIIVKETGHGGEWAAGETINPADLIKYNELNSGVVDRSGYKFTWEWGTDNGTPITEMPAGDLYVVGLYEPIVYTVTIHYVEKGTGTRLFDDYIGHYYYQDEFSVISPLVNGYLAQQTVVSGKIDSANNLELTVQYEKTQGQLNIVYVFGDSQTEAAPTHNSTISVGDSYSVNSPAIYGYTADQVVVSGTVTGEQAENGITVYVTYTPNNYTVLFDAAGGTLQTASKTVAYNNVYGFDPSKPYGEQYYALPIPLRTGYEFIGWQDANGNLITEESVVTLAENHTLTAKWQGQNFKLTVYYHLNSITGDSPFTNKTRDIYNVEYSTDYCFDAPYFEGYSPYFEDLTTSANVISGTMGAGSRIVHVIYTIDQHSITIHYEGPKGKEMAPDVSVIQDYGTDYSFTSPTFAGYTYDKSVVSGTVGTKDIEITVNYEYIDYTLTVTYSIDDESLKPENAVVEKLHIGDTYEIETPEIEGYTANVAVVSGTVGSSDINYVVTYTRNNYTLKINYVYGEDILDTSLVGTAVQPSVSYTIPYGSEYNYSTPVINGYFATVDCVSGTMPAVNVEITVYYTQVISVDISWGDMTFDYAQGVWDNDTHEYYIPAATDDSNYIIVTNGEESSTQIAIDITYTTNSGFESIHAFFTIDGSDDILNAPHGDIVVGESAKYWLWLKGTMPEGLDYTNDTQTTGICTVTIGGAD